MMPFFIIASFLQGATPGSSAIPILSVGAVFSLCTAAVGYGVVKSKADGAVRGNTANRQEMHRCFAEFDRKAESRELALNARLDRIDTQMGDIREKIGRLQGSIDNDD